MAFLGKYQIKSKIVIKDDIIEQVRHFNYLGCDISYEKDNDVDNKLAKFRNVCGTIHKYPKHKTRKDTRLKFYKTTAVPILIHSMRHGYSQKKKKVKFSLQKCYF
jgi:hypothetical protein